MGPSLTLIYCRCSYECLPVYPSTHRRSGNANEQLQEGSREQAGRQMPHRPVPLAGSRSCARQQRSPGCIVHPHCRQGCLPSSSSLAVECSCWPAPVCTVQGEQSKEAAHPNLLGAQRDVLRAAEDHQAAPAGTGGVLHPTGLQKDLVGAAGVAEDVAPGAAGTHDAGAQSTEHAVRRGYRAVWEAQTKGPCSRAPHVQLAAAQHCDEPRSQAACQPRGLTNTTPLSSRPAAPRLVRIKPPCPHQAGPCRGATRGRPVRSGDLPRPPYTLAIRGLSFLPASLH